MAAISFGLPARPIGVNSADTRDSTSSSESELSSERDLRSAGIRFYDLDTTQSSLEEIFVSLVRA